MQSKAGRDEYAQTCDSTCTAVGITSQWCNSKPVGSTREYRWERCVQRQVTGNVHFKGLVQVCRPLTQQGIIMIHIWIFSNDIFIELLDYWTIVLRSKELGWEVHYYSATCLRHWLQCSFYGLSLGTSHVLSYLIITLSGRRATAGPQIWVLRSQDPCWAFMGMLPHLLECIPIGKKGSGIQVFLPDTTTQVTALPSGSGSYCGTT